jgi:hypothetical protein
MKILLLFLSLQITYSFHYSNDSDCIVEVPDSYEDARAYLYAEHVKMSTSKSTLLSLGLWVEFGKKFKDRSGVWQEFQKTKSPKTILEYTLDNMEQTYFKDKEEAIALFNKIEATELKISSENKCYHIILVEVAKKHGIEIVSDVLTAFAQSDLFKILYRND